tara:strand:- start:502 stop:738 length:237 start_codon:yes stop_codon:yes gene_type:complete
MLDVDELEAMASNIKELESQLAQARKEYREKRTANLRNAVEARKEADKLVQEELKALGVNTSSVYSISSGLRNSWFNV